MHTAQVKQFSPVRFEDWWNDTAVVLLAAADMLDGGARRWTAGDHAAASAAWSNLLVAAHRSGFPGCDMLRRHLRSGKLDGYLLALLMGAVAASGMSVASDVCSEAGKAGALW